MTTTAATWFFRQPEKKPFLIAERVRTTFWDQRIGGLWLDTVSAETPIKMVGYYNGSRVTMEWEPGKWLRLATKPGAPPLANSLTNLLYRKPVLRYEDTDGNTVWEWWIDPEAADRRWQEIQGKPSFGSPVRPDK
jgi:hypothetical protein